MPSRLKNIRPSNLMSIRFVKDYKLRGDMKSKKPDLSKVLFQKLGNTWYAFSEVDQEEVIYTALPKGINPRVDSLELYEVLEDHVNKMAA